MSHKTQKMWRVINTLICIVILSVLCLSCSGDSTSKQDERPERVYAPVGDAEMIFPTPENEETPDYQATYDVDMPTIEAEMTQEWYATHEVALTKYAPTQTPTLTPTPTVTPTPLPFEATTLLGEQVLLVLESSDLELETGKCSEIPSDDFRRNLEIGENLCLLNFVGYENVTPEEDYVLLAQNFSATGAEYALVRASNSTTGRIPEELGIANEDNFQAMQMPLTPPDMEITTTYSSYKRDKSGKKIYNLGIWPLELPLPEKEWEILVTW